MFNKPSLLFFISTRLATILSIVLGCVLTFRLVIYPSIKQQEKASNFIIKLQDTPVIEPGLQNTFEPEEVNQEDVLKNFVITAINNKKSDIPKQTDGTDTTVQMDNSTI